MAKQARWKLWVQIILIAGLFQLSSVLFFAAPVTAKEVKKTLLLYETEHRFGDPFPLVAALEELLGRYRLQLEPMPRSALNKGILGDYEIIVYLGTEKAFLPEFFLEETAGASRILWLGENIEQVAAARRWIDFNMEGRQSGFRSLEYGGKAFTLQGQPLLPVTEPGAEAQILATMDRGAGKVPFAWQRENLCYLAGLFLDIPSVAVLAGVLDEFLSPEIDVSPGEEELLKGRYILLSMGEINPFSDPVALSLLLDTVAGHHLPFALKVTPEIRLRGGGRLTLEDNPELVATLQQAARLGGSIIQYGMAMQQTKNFTEPEQFWDFQNDRPLKWEEGELREKIEQSLEVFARTSLYPVAFEVPGRAISREGYMDLARHYSSLYGALLLSDGSGSYLLELPWVTYSHRAGMLVYPQNMIWNPGDPLSVWKIVEQLQQLAVLPHSFAGISLPPYASPQQLAYLLEQLKPLGFTFADLRITPFEVNSRTLQVRGKQGNIQVFSAHAGRAEKDTEKAHITKFLEIFLVIVGIIIFLFLLVVRSLQRNRNRLYEEEIKVKGLLELE